MANIKDLHAFAKSLFSEKMHSSHYLKAQIEKKLNIINNQTNGEIYELFNEIQALNNHRNNTSCITAAASLNEKKEHKGRKRKCNISENHDIEPPTKRKKLNQMDKNNEYNNNYNSRIRGSIRSSSLLSLSAKKHRKLTMGTTSSTNTSNHSIEANTPINYDDDEHYLYEMLENAQRAKQLTQNNIEILRKCINSVDVFTDVLEGDIMELSDEIRKTFQVFPFKNITPSYYHKMLEEQLRSNRILAKYPNLEQTEDDVYKLQSRYISQYTEKSSEKGTEEMVIKKKKQSRENDDGNVEEKKKQKLQNRNHDKVVNSNDTDDKWCICKKASSGKMIRCDNKLCSIQWYHWKCITIRKIPINKWYCKSCRRYPSRPYLMHRRFEIDENVPM